MKLTTLSKYSGKYNELIEDYCRIFKKKHDYDIKKMITNVFEDIEENKKNGYVLLDGDRLVGAVIYHLDENVGVIHFAHILGKYTKPFILKKILSHFVNKKIKENLPKIVTLFEIFNFGKKQLNSIMLDFDFEKKKRDLFELDIEDYKEEKQKNKKRRKLNEKISIRPFRYENLKEISKLAHYAFAGSLEQEVFPSGFNIDDYEQEINNAINGIYGKFLPYYSKEVYYKDELIGALISTQDQDTLVIHQFFIKPKKWGNKYGYDMLVRLINYVIEKDKYSSIATFISHDNKRVKNLLEGIGFDLEIEMEVYSRLLL